MAIACVCASHKFSSKDEAEQFRADLLSWYDNNRRDLPWRTMAERERDPNMRGYLVWVSEVMLQQTQVATVVDYYNRWIQKWPTVDRLAAASLEEVREAWSGLGYYSRAQRLREAARKVVGELEGQLPQTSTELARQLPGVGRYTASAIASIAYGEECGVVDGNVVRVWSRLKIIGAQSSSSIAMHHYWQLSSEAVVGERPGDLNQALMELGATVCTPQSPRCDRCPVRGHCGAHLQVRRGQSSQHHFANHPVCDDPTQSATQQCPLCLPHHQPWDISLGVTNYPRKEKRKSSKEEHFTVGVVEWNEASSSDCRFLIQCRPMKGELDPIPFHTQFVSIGNAPLYPSNQTVQFSRHGNLSSNTCHLQHSITHTLEQYVSPDHTLSLATPPSQVSHQFSHTLHHYHVWHLVTPSRPSPPSPPHLSKPHKWVTGAELLQSAISTAVRKISRLVSKGPSHVQTSECRRVRRGRAGCDQLPTKRQKTLDSFVH